MNNQEKIVARVASLVTDTVKELETNPYGVPVGISAHHIHLSKEAVSILFGKEYSITLLKKLSQPGQYAAAEQIKVIGPSGSITKMRIMGPERPDCQIEITYSDARILGVDPPVRASGDIKGTPGIRLVGPEGEMTLDSGVIIAERHVHMSPADARWFGVSDGQQVKIKISGPKAGVMEKVTVRVKDSYCLDFHIDTDDANAFLLRQGEKVQLVK